jgi:hypothetical protein
MVKNLKKITILSFYHQNKMFFIRLFVFISIICLLDFTIGSILNYYYFKQLSGYEYRSIYSFEKTKAEILIFGSSTANSHYYPPIFEKRLSMSCYNTGRDGTSIYYDYAVLRSVLKRYTPKIIILDFNSNYDKSQGSYDRISALLPFYQKHPEIHDIVNLKSSWENIKLLLKIYPYNSLVFSILAGNSELNRQRTLDIKGFMQSSKVWNEPIKTVSQRSYHDLDSTKVKIYESFIRECVASNIRLYVVCSPSYFKYNSLPNDILMGKQIAEKYNIDFFNYLQDTALINHNKYFQDPYHMNTEGAKIFTNMVINLIMRDNKK